jgi:hypothetical protein
LRLPTVRIIGSDMARTVVLSLVAVLGLDRLALSCSPPTLILFAGRRRL